MMTDSEEKKVDKLQEAVDAARELELDTTLLTNAPIQQMRQHHELEYLKNFIDMQQELALLAGLEKDRAELPEDVVKRAEQWLALDKKEKEKKIGLIDTEKMKTAVKVMDILPHKRAEVYRLKLLCDHWRKAIPQLDEIENARKDGKPYKA